MVTPGLIVSLAWLAHGGGVAGAAVDRFEPAYAEDLVGLQDVDFDSGWFPANAPVQLRIYAHAADSIVVEMSGDGIYDWDAQTLGFEGDPDGGSFRLDVGLELQASVRFDVAGIQWESDILGPWDYAITAEAPFTPYLLPGHPQAPVEIEDQTDGVTVASVPIVPNIVVASGNLDIDVSAELSAQLAGVRIEASAADGMTDVDAWGMAAPLSPDPGVDPFSVDGVMVASLQAAPVLIVRPHLVMSILLQEFEIVGIDIPIALPPTDDTLTFEPETMEFDVPEPASEDTTGGDDGSAEGGGQDAGADGADGGTSTGGGSGGETDSEGDPACCDDAPAGCGCHSPGPGRTGGLAFGLWVLAVVRRRRAA
ncbi:MAG: hypothetical protein K0V04_33685 [Deltaproteobacteria bacterium]|nr:hypothetical protein [Deltaproteobacteria bacterium]